MKPVQEELDRIQKDVDVLEADKRGDFIGEDYSALLHQLKDIIYKIKSMSASEGSTVEIDEGKQAAFFRSDIDYSSKVPYYELLEYNDACRELKRIIDEYTDAHVIASAFNELGRLQALQGEYQKAYYSFNQVISFYPQYKEAYFNLGLINIFLKNLEEAASCLQKAAALSPDDKKSYYLLSDIYRSLKKDKTADYYYECYKNLK